MLKGKVISVKSQKQFGFIGIGKDEYFFHREDFNGHWDDLCGDVENRAHVEVQFEADRTPKGLRARNVSRTDWPNTAA